jgi:hypothetical protein
VSEDRLDLLVDLVAERVAIRVLAELNGHAAPWKDEDAEPWKLFNLEEAAARLGRSTRWVRDHRDEIGWVRLDGSALAFRLEDLQAFAERRRIGGP